MVTVGKSLQGKKGEAGVSVSNFSVGARVMVGGEAPGEAVQVGGSSQTVG